ncbi:cupin domain-containing protein [Microbispora sp. ATCC PTA-5024]|uniref:cupin domain-containing protein n=1 Tax=Microbispora sp. ATCC PTA-5024 TaxID=316330 RepID=UPI0003DC44C4|nr:cupin domain-containing protein [Microbispora sp. ATCC PTA-5024]ETK35022.1 cupin [Microbispora sp. ATCC PTA-5024]
MTVIDPNDARAVLVRAGEAEVLGEFPNTLELLADAETTGGLVSAIRSKIGKNTDGPPPHYHNEAAEIFYIIDGGLHVLTGEHVVTVGTGDFLLVPPRTPHAFSTPAHTGVDMVIFKPGAERFGYFRLGDLVRRGEASPQEILDAQDLYDNHFHHSAVWRRFRGAEAESRLLVLPPNDDATPGQGRDGDTRWT